ncbi:heparan-alpha-glucosaminide N-acetyltransferase domain-containing protein [Microbacterium thalassium]|uniref:Putative membrane protein YeiB n=1 Tax=Microbacterium thalassium TaxID=362649 RepID=A0A7X0FPZ4_9MICO|nr:heparan-alpha-glucosaminide N-acetyltransferase domain-containing protein [Microbacterium thalassium]MBB6391565.1 putative membrane protein YeiB [Microbacterium thalassium]GLK24041.1 hypothetical protein GCM10017607_13590 [Microbacterium thalassium]
MSRTAGQQSETGRPRSLRAHWDHLNAPPRVAGVDFARGLAVIGMFAAHLLVIDGTFDWADPSTWDAVVNGNSSILFATLAGVSIGLYTGGRLPVEGPARRTLQGRLLVRAAALWAIGLFLTLLATPVYVILPAYGVMFALAIPLVGASARTLFLAAGAVAVVMPFVHAWLAGFGFWSTALGREASAVLGWHYPFEVWFAFVLAGLGLARAGLTRLRTLLIAVVSGAALVVVGDAIGDAMAPADAASASTYLARVWSAEPHSSGLPEIIGSGGLAIAVIAACVLLCRPWGRADAGTGPIGYALLPLRAVGAMPLTAYVVQLLVIALIQAFALGGVTGIGDIRAVDPFWPLTIGIIVCCTAWALLLGRGPLERVLDTAGRWLVPPR